MHKLDEQKIFKCRQKLRDIIKNKSEVITCPYCGNNKLNKNGFDKTKTKQRYRCLSCSRKFTYLNSIIVNDGSCEQENNSWYSLDESLPKHGQQIVVMLTYRTDFISGVWNTISNTFRSRVVGARTVQMKAILAWHPIPEVNSSIKRNIRHELVRLREEIDSILNNTVE